MSENADVSAAPGLILHLGQWAMHQAAQTLAGWDLRAGEKLPLFADLLAGRPVQGIVPAARSGGLMLFRIDHAAIR